MNTKSAAGMFLLAALLFAPSAFAQEQVGGVFYNNCGPTDAPVGVIIELDPHLRITVFGKVEPDGAYRTKAETFDGEKPTMEVEICGAKMQNCKPVEGILTTYKADGEVIEGAIEYFDGTETQGDAESIQGHTIYFEVKKKNSDNKSFCG